MVLHERDDVPPSQASAIPAILVPIAVGILLLVIAAVAIKHHASKKTAPSRPAMRHIEGDAGFTTLGPAGRGTQPRSGRRQRSVGSVTDLPTYTEQSGEDEVVLSRTLPALNEESEYSMDGIDMGDESHALGVQLHEGLHSSDDALVIDFEESRGGTDSTGQMGSTGESTAQTDSRGHTGPTDQTYPGAEHSDSATERTNATCNASGTSTSHSRTNSAITAITQPLRFLQNTGNAIRNSTLRRSADYTRTSTSAPFSDTQVEIVDLDAAQELPPGLVYPKRGLSEAQRKFIASSDNVSKYGYGPDYAQLDLSGDAPLPYESVVSEAESDLGAESDNGSIDVPFARLVSRPRTPPGLPAAESGSSQHTRSASASGANSTA